LGETEYIFPAERKHVEIGTVEKNMLLIFDIISAYHAHRSQVGELF
jgi:hypothetical protein